MNGIGGKAVGDERKKDQVKGVANGPRSFPFLDISVGSVQFSSVQSLSHVQLFATLWTATRQASLVHHQLLDLAQTHVQGVGDAIQASLPLSSSSAFNLSQYQGLFQGVGSSHQVANLLEFQLQHQSFQ